MSDSGDDPATPDPTRIGPIEQLTPLREGVLGPVYTGRDPRLEQKVVVTLLRPEVAADVARRDAFLVEARAAAQLEHPHLAAVHSVGEDGGRAYVVRPFVEGRLLSERLAEQGPLPLEQALRVIAQATTAIVEAHRRGQTHGGIDPSTLVWNPRAGAKVLDLGTARRGVERGDRRADVLALARTLAALLQGASPPVDADAEALRAWVAAIGSLEPAPAVRDWLTACLAGQGVDDAEAFSLRLVEVAQPIAADLPRPRPVRAVPGAGTGDRALKTLFVCLVALFGLVWAWAAWRGP